MLMLLRYSVPKKKGIGMQTRFKIESEQDLDPLFERLFELLKGEPSSSVQQEADRLLAVFADYENDVRSGNASA